MLLLKLLSCREENRPPPCQNSLSSQWCGPGYPSTHKRKVYNRNPTPCTVHYGPCEDVTAQDEAETSGM